MSIFHCRVLSIAECYKGGGGGGSSGKTDFPAYMKAVHSDWLSGGNIDNTPNEMLDSGKNINALLNNALEISPYEGESAYNPDEDIAAFVAAIDLFEGDLVGVSDWDVLLTVSDENVRNLIDDESKITALTTTHGAMLADKLTTEVLPRFETGMRDINAVQSSSFVIGKAILEGFNTREVAEFDAKLRLQSNAQTNQYVMEGIKDQLHLTQLRLQFRDSIAKTTIEGMRIKAVLKKEQISEGLDILSKDYTWGLDLFQAGSNVMASISGAALSKGTPTQSPSMLGGALSGAAAGATAGSIIPGIGTGIGAGIGALVGAFSS